MCGLLSFPLLYCNRKHQSMLKNSFNAGIQDKKHEYLDSGQIWIKIRRRKWWWKSQTYISARDRRYSCLIFLCSRSWQNNITKSLTQAKMVHSKKSFSSNLMLKNVKNLLKHLKWISCHFLSSSNSIYSFHLQNVEIIIIMDWYISDQIHSILEEWLTTISNLLINFFHIYP